MFIITDLIRKKRSKEYLLCKILNKIEMLNNIELNALYICGHRAGSHVADSLDNFIGGRMVCVLGCYAGGYGFDPHR